MADRRILHCDMDSFYASVHVRDDPELAGKPVVIGGDPNSRGVVAAASYEARKFGVRSAIPCSRAARLCPQAVFIRPDFPRYRAESEKVMAILRRYTPTIQPVSIDEAYLDVSEELGEHRTATRLARHIKRTVLEERGLTISIGVAPNRLVAKIASDQDKPDGLTVVPPARVLDFLAPLPVRRLHGVGPATEKALVALGVQTIADLRELDQEELGRRFGQFGAALYRYARGIDDRPVETSRVRKSLSSERTFDTDLSRPEAIAREIERLAVEVAVGLARRKLKARTISIKARYPDFETVSRARTVARPISAADDVLRIAQELIGRTDAGRRPIRLLGVGASGLVRGDEGQLSLFTADEDESDGEDG